MATKRGSTEPRPSHSPVWVWNQAQISGRAGELSYERYVAAMGDQAADSLDSYVELQQWTHAMRMLLRIGEAATSIGAETVDAAVAEFKLEVKPRDLIQLRNVFEQRPTT